MVQNVINKIINKIKDLEESFTKNKTILPIERNVQLNSYSCGIYSAFACLKFHNRVKKIKDIKFDKILVEKDGLDTEPLLNIITSNRAFADINGSADLNDIKRAIDEGNPIIISIYEGDHWVVIYGYSEDKIFILDSSLASSIRCGIPVKRFLEIWDENWIAVIKKGEVKKEMPVIQKMAV